DLRRAEAARDGPVSRPSATDRVLSTEPHLPERPRGRVARRLRRRPAGALRCDGRRTARRLRLRLMLPNFLVIGAMKAGTTSLWAYLRQHPDVFMPEDKELNFFVTKVGHWDKGVDWYKSMFEG